MHVLRKKGVRDSDILVFTDHPAATAHFAPYGFSNLYALAALRAVLATKSYRYVVAMCGGHGSHLGLQAGANPPVSPHELFVSVRAVKGAEVGVVILSQCFGGVFHFMDATSGAPSIVVIGSTMFYPTLSSQVSLKVPVQTSAGANGLSAWLANLYQVQLFEWLASPSDVDGDGHVTLVDAYKFAGAKTVESIGDIWVNVFADLRKAQDALAAAQAQKNPPAHPLVLKAHRELVSQTVQLLYNIQEPWLLNARLAARVHFV